MLAKLNRFSFSVTTPSFAKGGADVGTLQDSTTAPNITFGLICSEWCEWLPALPFVPILPLWIWCHSIRWCQILAKVLPNITFVDGFTTPLPAVDVLLLSRVTLGQCNILLKHCPASLILFSIVNPFSHLSLTIIALTKSTSFKHLLLDEVTSNLSFDNLSVDKLIIFPLGCYVY